MTFPPHNGGDIPPIFPPHGISERLFWRGQKDGVPPHYGGDQQLCRNDKNDFQRLKNYLQNFNFGALKITQKVLNEVLETGESSGDSG